MLPVKGKMTPGEAEKLLCGCSVLSLVQWRNLNAIMQRTNINVLFLVSFLLGKLLMAAM